MINRLTIFLIFLLISLGCKKKEPTESYCQQNAGNCQSINEAKDYFAFKLGSWWVYEEENTLQRDSMYVIESYINPSNYDFNIRIQSSLTGYRYHYWPEYYPSVNGCYENKPVQKKCLYVMRSKGKSQDYLGSNYCFFIFNKSNDFIYTGSTTFCNNMLIYKDLYSNYSLNQLSFKDVIETLETCSQNENYQEIKTFYSKNTGIIRKELLDSNQVWNLVKFHIEK